MKRTIQPALILFFLYCINPVALFSQDLQRINLVPQPQVVVEKKGSFLWSENTPVYAEPVFQELAKLFAMQASLSLPRPYNRNLKSNTHCIIFRKQKFTDTSSAEAYKLVITPQQVQILAANEQGMLRAMFTLLQLQLLQTEKTLVPCGEITDAPRFLYRGLHLDVSRNFFPIPVLEKLLDMMALYKLNTFHWHLTDGPGWRLEIKKYPQLTKKAAWRTKNSWKEWWNSDRLYSAEGAADAYGGYYTQEEAKELVSYAAKRGITIIPEIEMPGHSEEVLAVFPNLACSGKPYTQSEFCIGNDSTFLFMEDVLTEVMQVFPSSYIHIGGDEAGKESWKNCPKCQARISSENLKDEHELQSYAIKRMDKFLSDHGRKLLGWDEILEGGLSPGATVMSWRGEAGGIAAAKAGHDVIMTPGGYCYFDNYQSNPATQPEAIGGYLPISKVYSYDPVPAELTADEARHILGVQANTWTEYIPTAEHLEYMIFPRFLALAEIGWSSKNQKDWTNFQGRLQQHYLLLQRKSINYYRPQPTLEINSVADTVSRLSRVSISSEQYKPEIHFTTNGSDPVKSSPIYMGPVDVKGIATIKAAILNPVTGKMGPVMAHQTAYHKAIGAQITYNLPFSNSYPAQQEYTLVNGQTGSFTYGDGQWQGFEGIDMDITLELKQLTDVKKIAVNFMQITGPGVFMPNYVEYSWSKNGKDYSAPVRIMNTVPDTESKLVIKPFEVMVNRQAKYIRIKAQNDKHGFLFADEVLVY
ncbi:beta-N-acetylhexosaminidase [Flavihumibacter profundi]|uniref:beta-N-acetylhexosaminidase n=1 Tax=Flavihumibacter profundi TaxID=2716883 RepID=UPI001CC6755A|nr:family 20 glycosylhydrolase [Flavihumibacter profundi]MBZ5857674.1 family 20 glycosylhydrolase [Flavihumibacter profundi]